MAVLETIRNKFGILITVLIAVALLSFIIDPTSLASLTGGQQEGEDTEVASINGTSVYYTDFSNEVRKYNDIYPFDAVMNVNDTLADPDYLKTVYNQQIRSMAFNNFIMENLLVVRAKDAGIYVGEEEMYQLLSGNVFSNTIINEFQGTMTPDRLVDIENNAAADASGRTQMWWDNVKKSTEYERYMTKYTESLRRSSFSNSLLAEEDIKNSNNIFDVEFVMVPFGLADSTVVVSEEEIKAYYDAHKNLFPCAETRDLEYVVVEFDAAEEDAVFEQVDSVFNNVNNVEDFQKAAVENGYFMDSINVPMYANSLGSITKAESIVKWAFKESAAGVVSEIFTVENDGKNYFIIAALANIKPEGYSPLEDVKPMIENVLSMEKTADIRLAEVTEKVNGLTDLNEIAKVLGTTVSSKDKLTFAASDFDLKFTGAASVAEEGVVSAPFKGTNGIYVYKINNRSEEAYYTEDDAKMRMNQLNAAYAQMLSFVLNKEGNVKDYTYLYF